LSDCENQQLVAKLNPTQISISKLKNWRCETANDRLGIALVDRLGRSILSQSAERMNPEEFLNYRWNRPIAANGDELWVALVPYDGSVVPADGNCQLRVWRMPNYQVCNGSVQEAEPDRSPPAWRWRFEHSDIQYLDDVSSIKEQIRRGDFYQLNLCRRLFSENGFGTGEIAQRLLRFGGPFSAWIHDMDFELVSFSPEEFVGIEPSGGKFKAWARPIKGTVQRVHDVAEDQLLREQLIQSPKDRAELTMIIDLMRNDLLRVCNFGSVRVSSAGHLESFENVHHLVGEIEGVLVQNCIMAELIKSLCPSGSITGAPKTAVMKFISNYEKFSRNYFMGNLFLLEPATGRLRSSVLIRTMQKNPNNAYEFLVGSGIVVRSDPELERRELEAKARVVADELMPGD
jgi:anthranilate/para-aminobenzoate synthase component I